MPVMSCNENGKSGFKYGASGKCYTYNSGDKKGADKAKQRAYLQGAAISGGKLTEEVLESMNDIEIGMEIFLLESKL